MNPDIVLEVILKTDSEKDINHICKSSREIYNTCKHYKQKITRHIMKDIVGAIDKPDYLSWNSFYNIWKKYKNHLLSQVPIYIVYKTIIPTQLDGGDEFRYAFESIYYLSYKREAVINFIKNDIKINDVGLKNYNHLEGYDDSNHNVILNDIYMYSITIYEDVSLENKLLTNKTLAKIFSNEHFLEYIPIYIVHDMYNDIENITVDENVALKTAKNYLEFRRNFQADYEDEVYIDNSEYITDIENKSIHPMTKYKYINPQNRLNLEKAWVRVNQDVLRKIIAEIYPNVEDIFKILSEYYLNNKLIDVELFRKHPPLLEIILEIKYRATGLKFLFQVQWPALLTR